MARCHKRPTATIVIPLRRQEDSYLRKCLWSAVRQTADSEIVVVQADDTPPRNLCILEEIQAQAPQLSILTQRRDGFAAALNTGIEEAKSSRVGFLLSDDWLEPTAVEECLPHDTDIVSTDKTHYDASGKTPLFLRKPRSAAAFNDLQRFHEKASYLSHFFLFKKEALEAIGGVDEEIGLTGPDDFDMIWTLLERGASVSLVEKPLYNYRDHDGERLTLRDAAAQTRDLKKILTKHGVYGQERESAVESCSRWYGKTIQAAREEIRVLEAAQQPKARNDL